MLHVSFFLHIKSHGNYSAHAHNELSHQQNWQRQNFNNMAMLGCCTLPLAKSCQTHSSCNHAWNNQNQKPLSNNALIWSYSSTYSMVSQISLHNTDRTERMTNQEPHPIIHQAIYIQETTTAWVADLPITTTIPYQILCSPYSSGPITWGCLLLGSRMKSFLVIVLSLLYPVGVHIYIYTWSGFSSMTAVGLRFRHKSKLATEWDSAFELTRGCRQ